jgi:hypothetical protein
MRPARPIALHCGSLKYKLTGETPVPTFTTKSTGVPTAKLAIWLALTEEEYAVIQSMTAGKQSPRQLLKEIAEEAIYNYIDANRKKPS